MAFKASHTGSNLDSAPLMMHLIVYGSLSAALNVFDYSLAWVTFKVSHTGSSMDSDSMVQGYIGEKMHPTLGVTTYSRPISGHCHCDHN